MAPAGLIVALVVIYLMARIGCLRAYMKRERGECKKPVSQGRIKARTEQETYLPEYLK